MVLQAVKKYLKGNGAGLTFVELLVSFIVLAIVALPLLNLFTACFAVIIHAGHKTAAVNLCREKMEIIKANGYSFYIDLIRSSPDGVYVEIEDPVGNEDFYRRETRLQLATFPLEGEEAALLLLTLACKPPGRIARGDQAVRIVVSCEGEPVLRPMGVKGSPSLKFCWFWRSWGGCHGAF